MDMKAGANQPLHSTGKDDWQTPIKLFRRLERLATVKFNLDPCTREDNPLDTKHFFTEKENGLVVPWNVEPKTTAFMNMPYSQVEKWAQKARRETQKHDVTVFGLLPVRTPRWFEDLVIRHECQWLQHLGDWIHLKKGQTATWRIGRIKFIDPATGAPTKTQAPFDSWIVIWN